MHIRRGCGPGEQPLGRPRLFASAHCQHRRDLITLKYTRNDNMVHGFTLHLGELCVDTPLLSLYQSLNAAGRSQLPALRPGQAVGRAAGAVIGVTIRDSGTFMDPRSRKDWWRGH